QNHPNNIKGNAIFRKIARKKPSTTMPLKPHTIFNIFLQKSN
ncbi:12225_t:CDS:1, partial [Dentiscutata heterogama]